MYLLFRCVAHKAEVRALHFHCTAPLLISGDAVGTVFVWGIANTVTPTQDNVNTYTAHPLMALILSERSTVPRTPTSPQSRVSNPGDEPIRLPPHAHRPIITTLCSTEEPHASIFAGDSDGDIHRWDLRALQQVAIKRDINPKHFESQRLVSEGADTLYKSSPTPTSNNISLEMSAPSRGKQHSEKQQLRVNHKLSILRLQGDDRHWFRGLQQVPRTSLVPSEGGNSQSLFSPPSSIPGCHASCTWAAHLAPVAGMRSVLFPGAVFTYSTDCMVKVWDWDGGCMGLFSTCLSGTSSEHKRPTPADFREADTATKKADDGQPPAWKFTRHMIGDESVQHQMIATEVIRKHQRERQRKFVATLPTESYFEGSYADPIIQPYQPTGVYPERNNSVVPFSSTCLFPVHSNIDASFLTYLW